MDEVVFGVDAKVTASEVCLCATVRGDIGSRLVSDLIWISGSDVSSGSDLIGGMSLITGSDIDGGAGRTLKAFSDVREKPVFPLGDCGTVSGRSILANDFLE